MAVDAGTCNIITIIIGIWFAICFPPSVVIYMIVVDMVKKNMGIKEGGLAAAAESLIPEAIKTKVMILWLVALVIFTVLAWAPGIILGACYVIPPARNAINKAVVLKILMK